MNIISIDPGKHGCYCCAWEQARMVACEVRTNPFPWLPTPDSYTAVVERMQVRMGRYSDDLLDVHGAACRVTANIPQDRIVWCTPSQWKGQVPKEVHQRTRILPNISLDEMQLIMQAVPKAYNRHNMYDAFGIGMWYLKSKGLWNR